MADTAPVTLTSAEFTSLGAMPITVEHLEGPLIYLNIAASKPAATATGHRLFPDHTYPRDGAIGMNPWTGDTRVVWARVHALGDQLTAGKVIVTGAP